MKPIFLVTAAARDIRHADVGDWQDKGWSWLITAVTLPDWRMSVCLLVHELVEMACCKAHGVKEKAVDRWDAAFDGDGEAGDDPKAPYHREHVFATRIEQLLAQELGLNWFVYEQALERAQRFRK